MFWRKKSGKRLLEAAQAGKEPHRSIVESARREEARDEDIEEYWNLPEKVKQLVLFQENVN